MPDEAQPQIPIPIQTPAKRVCRNCGGLFWCYRAPGAPVAHVFCVDCFSERYFACRHCGLMKADGASSPMLFNTSFPGRLEGSYWRGQACEDCFHKLYRSCIHCGIGVLAESPAALEVHHPTTGEISGHICTGCAPRRTVSCGCCNRRFNGQPLMIYRYRGAPACLLCCDSGAHRVRTKHIPSKRLVGYELEFITETSRDNLNEQLRRYGRIKSDGSVVPVRGQYGAGAEFASHVAAGDDVASQVRQVCRILRRNMATVNRTCGFHVHFDMRKCPAAERTNVGFWWVRFERVFLAMVRSSRRNNSYCYPVTLGRSPSGARYGALNSVSLETHGTLEVRLHHGTVKESTIIAWIAFLSRFFDVFAKIPGTNSVAREYDAMSNRERLILLFRLMKAPLSTRKYVMRRIRRFDPSRQVPVVPPPFLDLAKKKKGA